MIRGIRRKKLFSSEEDRCKYFQYCIALTKLSAFRRSSAGPIGKGSGQTSMVEALNNKWRNRVSGLVRKAVVCASWMICENG